jgi:hypothetical protein
MQNKTRMILVIATIVLIMAAGIFGYTKNFADNKAGCRGQKYEFTVRGSSIKECRDYKAGCMESSVTDYTDPTGHTGTCFHGTGFPTKN